MADTDRIRTELTAPANQNKVVEVSVDTCWRLNFEEEIIVPEPIGAYYEMFNEFDESLPIKFGTRKYLLSVCFNPVISTSKEINSEKSRTIDSTMEPGVTLRFRVIKPQAFVYPSGRISAVTEKELQEAQLKFESGVAIFNNKFKIIIKDPLCGETILPVNFVLEWVSSNAHFTVYLKDAGSAVNKDTGIQVTTKNTKITMAHEFGHGFGLADEYGVTIKDNNGVWQTRTSVRYIKPEGTPDAKLEIIGGLREKDDPLATLYSAKECDVLKQRHGWPVAIEVQKLLRTKIARPADKKINCSIEMIKP